MRFLFIALLLMSCLTDDDSGPVCEDVQKKIGYCYIPLPANLKNGDTKQCGFASYGSCWSHADPDGNDRGTGSCEPEYKWVRECN